MWPILSVAIRFEHDVVTARQRARQIAAELGFDVQDQTRLATAVSEIARNAFTYARDGRVEFVLEGRTAPQIFTMRVTDHGQGIRDLQRILRGQYRSETGMGLGIVGARRLMDQFSIESTDRGTTVLLKKLLPPGAPLVTPQRIRTLTDALVRQQPQDPLGEIQLQNQELLRALDELRARQDELTRLNGELEDTNRGVVALYAELDEKADHLRRADDMKTRFLSNMSHEFRTPLNSILGLSRLLLEHTDGRLTAEQEKQVGFIRKAADDLSELVNDLLDLAKVEAGKIVVRPMEFEVANLFGALRGMLRPLLVNESVSLVFEDVRSLPVLYTDEGKVSQILRNFISNALKFTEQGEVRVSAAVTPDGDAIAFSVADTGIGIAPEDQQRIFEEFGQLENPLQKAVKGTGLGLPLSRRLAELLGGRITLLSAPGVGSTFTATIPMKYATIEPVLVDVDWQPDPRLEPVLVVEVSDEDAMIYEKFLKGSRFQPVRAATLAQARQILRGVRPVAVILDIVLRGEDTWGFLAELKREDTTRAIPVVVVTTVADQHKGYGLGADAYAVKPVERPWMLDTLLRVTTPPPSDRVLIIDDDETSRYLVRQSLADGPYTVVDVDNGRDGVDRAREDRPAVIFVDLVMPGRSGFEVIEELKLDTATRNIPVIVLTSQVLGPDEEAWLRARTAAVLSKAKVGRESVRGALARALTGSNETWA